MKEEKELFVSCTVEEKLSFDGKSHSAHDPYVYGSINGKCTKDTCIFSTEFMLSTEKKKTVVRKKNKLLFQDEAYLQPFFILSKKKKKETNLFGFLT